MSFSTVVIGPFKTRRRGVRPTVDGNSVIQELGFQEDVIYLYHWITNTELQDMIEEKEELAAAGWVINGEVAKDQIHEALDLFNARIVMQRLVSS